MKNPFRPNFGLSPTELAGREQLTSEFDLALAEGIGSPLRTTLISGVRGSGKTVLLNEFENIAASNGWVVIRAYPDRAMISDLIEVTIPRALSALDSHPIPPRRKITGATVAGVGIRTEVVDTPTPRATLITALRELVAAAEEHDAGVFITLDEIQSADTDDLASLATALQDLVRDEREIALAAAGLPEGIHAMLNHRGTTFLRRAEHVVLTPLSDEAVARAVRTTVEDHGRQITTEALDDVVTLVKGYPYLLQVVGSLAWARATRTESLTIESAHVHDIAEVAIQRMYSHVHAPALHHISPSQFEFLKAMAACSTPVRVAEIASELKTTTTALSMRRRALLDAGLIHAPRHGVLEFSLPYLRERILEEED
ncbi:AAA family ATPase [Corynebacterium tapiri]|uniref:ATP-binding protein n=1 Tax=Corynebacterium tapiri TaxID=1448266 RepID=A0A5C4U6T8_9CORY|nr:ATP-binding protein [Corynebacterium tapiri]TNL99832.1 ATP-binding protein [Corynebacterium tapiri]